MGANSSALGGLNSNASGGSGGMFGGRHQFWQYKIFDKLLSNLME